MSEPVPTTTDIVARLREWSAADLDTHAVLRRKGRAVAEVPWVRHATDLHADLAQAAAEIGRLRSEADKPDATDPLVDVIARMAAEYDRDEECDGAKINSLIEEAGHILGQRMGGWDRVVDLGHAMEVKDDKKA